MAKIMLVEDDNNLREIYEARLQAEGYAIVTAKDGEEALVVAKAEKPDLVISDVMMPKISGFEMLDILRNTEGLGAIKVIMLTALGQSEDQQRADKLGADRYLVKSQVTLEDIVKAAHDLLGDAAAAAPATPAPAADAAAEPAAPTPNIAVATPPAEPVAAAPEPAPAETSTPVASDTPATPVTEPPATDASTPAVAAEPVTPAEPVAAGTDTGATDAADEEASVEAKIEDFVAGASSEPNTPEPAPAAAPEPTPAEPAAATEPTAAETSAADDKLLKDAVNSLSAAAEEAAAPAATNDATPSPAPEPAPAAAPEPTPADPAATPDAPIDDGPAVSKKIIEPIDSTPKKDINQLLAEEEAKENSTPPSTPSNGADPNSIAL